MKAFISITEIAAPLDAVWSVMSDVARWPEWSPTVSGVDTMGCGTMIAGQRFRAVHADLCAFDWTVTDVRSPRGFTRVAKVLGSTLEADHAVDPLQKDQSVVRLRLTVKGPGARLVSRMSHDFLQSLVLREGEALRLRTEPARWLW